jgi:hypothetical protein
MVEYDPVDVERRVKAGEWMTTTAVGVLFRRDRTTVYRWAKRGLIGHRVSPGGGEIECDPADVLKLLGEYRTVRRGEETDPPAGPVRS